MRPEKDVPCKSWRGVFDMAPKTKKPSLSPPAEKRTAPKRGAQQRPPYRMSPSQEPEVRTTADARSRSPAPKAAPRQEAPADPVLKVEDVKIEPTGRDAPAAGAAPAGAAPGAAPAEAAPEAAPGAALQAALTAQQLPLEAPPAGEMQRMLSQLKGAANKGQPAGLQTYQSKTDTQSKRKYYYDCWIQANPKTTDAGGVRSRKSDKVDETQVEDHGWVDKEYVAAKLHLQDWKINKEQHIKLKFKLDQMPSRPHPARHLLEADMDPFEYRFTETKEKEIERNSRGFELLQQTALNAEEHAEALAAWDAAVPKGRTGLGAMGDNRPTKRNPSRSPPQEAAPAWLSTFKKEGANNFSALKRSMSILLGNADSLVKACDENKKVFKGDQLLTAYLETVRVGLDALRAADHAAASFELKHSTTPKNEAEATNLLAKFKEAADGAKAAKSAFSNSTSSMQSALKARLATLAA